MYNRLQVVVYWFWMGVFDDCQLAHDWTSHFQVLRSITQRFRVDFSCNLLTLPLSLFWVKTLLGQLHRYMKTRQTNHTQEQTYLVSCVQLCTICFDVFVLRVSCRGGLGCCLVPFCLDGCKDVIHVCPNCRYQISAWRRF